MFAKWFKSLFMVAIVACGYAASTAQAAPADIEIGGGWTAFYDDEYLDIVVDEQADAGMACIEKFAVFKYGPAFGSVDPLAITFLHDGETFVGEGEIPDVCLNDEFVWNLTASTGTAS